MRQSKLPSAASPPPARIPNSPPSQVRPTKWIACAIGVLALCAAGGLTVDWWYGLPDEATARYVGRDRCVHCHTREAELYRGSHHDLAMAEATPETVLGDFNGAEFTHFDVTSRMYRDGDRYMVHTDGPDGKMGDFQVKYVFGVDPLQQYMVEFDRRPDQPSNEIARLQVLRISWDTARKKWFYLSPPDVSEKLSPDDDLHWTGIAQRWNYMCADCHSTNLQKRFDSKNNTYHTTFSEIDVSCEACHGPGSLHVELAESRSLFWDRKRGYGLARLKGKDTEPEIQACAPCHSRRRVIHEGYVAGDKLHDFHATGLLDSMTYYADGQIMDEVYEYGSFVQSKMYHKGIRCSDCHDPHSARLKHEGNQVCTSCHQHAAGKYDSMSHHHHAPGTPGASCVECHMPQTTYMAVDPRRDHSLRIPRPDLSVLLGTPNACTRCHLDAKRVSESKQSGLKEYSDWLAAVRRGDEEIRAEVARVDQWMTESIEKWYPEPNREPHFAAALHAARQRTADSEQQLLRTAQAGRYPAIARATAVAELGRWGSPQGLSLSAKLLSDADAQVRAAAVSNFTGQPLETLIKNVVPLLSDPVRMVRLEAARVMAPVPWQELRREQREALDAAVKEFVDSLLVNSDQAGAYLPLGTLYEQRGDIGAAIEAYETALRVQPLATGPRSNLAVVLEQRAEKVEQQLRDAQTQGGSPPSESSLAQAKKDRERVQKLRAEELEFLARDARLVPDNAMLQYRLGLSLYLHGKLADAESALTKAVQLEPDTPDFVLALALLYQRLGDRTQARQFARRLVDLRPEDRSYQQLLFEIENPEANQPSPGP